MTWSVLFWKIKINIYLYIPIASLFREKIKLQFMI